MRRDAGAALEAIGRVFGSGPGGGSLAGLGESDLLGRFTRHGDGAAFAAIVARHGPMVRGVCRRALGDSAEVDDAFQATFLVLVRRAGSIREGAPLGPWLYGVARRVAIRARGRRDRRFVVESGRADPAVAEGTPRGADSSVDPEDLVALDDELARLPDSLRSPLVLCYLEGLTHDEAADRLRWPVGTVRSRMARARGVLRGRLARRGCSPAGIGLVAGRSLGPVPPSLVDATTRASLLFLRSPRAIAGPAVALAQGVITAMSFSPLKLAAATGLIALAAVGGGTTIAYQIGGNAPRAMDPPPDPVAGPPDARPNDGSDDYQDRLEELFLKQQIDNLLDDLRKEVDTKWTPSTRMARKQALGALSGELTRAKSRLDRDLALVYPSNRRDSPQPHAESEGPPQPKIAPTAPAALGGDGGGTIPAAVGVAGNGPFPALAAQLGRNLGVQSGPAGGELKPAAGGPPLTLPTNPFPGSGAVEPGDAPITVETSGTLFVVARDGSAAAAIRRSDGQRRVIQLPRLPGQVLRVVPVVGQSVAALDIVGPGVSVAAAYSVDRGEWYLAAIDPPADAVHPIIGPNMVAYANGNRVSAFGAKSGHWEVLTLPEGVVAQPVVMANSVTLNHNGWIHTFGGDTGHWTRIDTRDLLRPVIPGEKLDPTSLPPASPGVGGGFR